MSLEMGRLQRSKSFPPVWSAYRLNIDEALSNGFQNTRDSLRWLQPSLEEEYKSDINDLVKKVEALERKRACSKAEANDLKNNLKEAEKRIAEAEAEFTYWKKKFADVALSNGFQNTRDSLRWLQPSLEEEYKSDINDLVKKVEALERKLACSKAEANDLKNNLKEAEKRIAEAEAEVTYCKKKFADFERKKLLRDVLSKFKRCCQHANKEMMEEVHRKFPKVFHERFTTFTAMVSDLVRRQMSGENVEQRLCDLLEVATDPEFRPGNLAWWDRETGKQFFHLCRSVAQWNKDTFHQELKGNLSRPIMMNRIRMGLFKVDDKGVFSDIGVDLGKVLRELLYVDR